MQEDYIERIRNSFRDYLKVVWYYQNLPEPTEIQKRIADTLQYGGSRVMIQAFRGVGKSWITSAYVSWLLWNNQQKEILVLSASSKRAVDFSRFTKNLLDVVPILNPLKPDKSKNQRDSFVAFDVNGHENSHSPSVKSIGITGQITGSRADLIIADDIEIPSNSETVEKRENLLRATHELDHVLKPNGSIIYLGTPHTEESVYKTIRDSGNYTVRIWPARYPKDPWKYEGMLDEKIAEQVENNPEVVGEPTEPKRFDNEILERRKAAVGSKEFALQYMLDTTLSDLNKYPLKIKDLIVMELDKSKGPIDLTWGYGEDQKFKELTGVGHSGDYFYKPSRVDDDWRPYDTVVMGLDPSGRGSDETGYVVIGKIGARLFVLDFGGFQGGYEESTLNRLANIASEYNVNKIVIESNFGDGMFTRLITPVVHQVHSCEIEEVSNNIQKEKRIIDTLEPLMARHRLVFNLEAVMRDIKETYKSPETYKFQYSLFYQMTRITYDRHSLPHDDRLDVLAIATQYFKDWMAMDDKKAYQKYKEDKWEQEVEDFRRKIEEFHGPRKEQNDKWTNEYIFDKTY